MKNQLQIVFLVLNLRIAFWATLKLTGHIPASRKACLIVRGLKVFVLITVRSRKKEEIEYSRSKERKAIIIAL